MLQRIVLLRSFSNSAGPSKALIVSTRIDAQGGPAHASTTRALLERQCIDAVDGDEGYLGGHASAVAWRRSNLKRAANHLHTFIHADEAEPFPPDGVDVEPGAIVADGERDLIRA